MTNARNVLPLVAAKVVTLGLQIASVRTYVRVLGDDAYGVVVYFTAIMGYVLLVDFGILSAAQRELLEIYARGERQAVRRAIKDAARMLLLSLLVGWGIYALLGSLLSLPFSDTVAASPAELAAFGCLHLAGNLAFLFCNGILAGAARFRRLGLSLAGGGVFAPGLGIAGVLVYRAPVGAIGGTALGFVLASALAMWLASVVWREAPREAGVSNRTKNIVSAGARAVASRVSAQFGSTIDRVIIGNTVPTVLTPYALCYQVAHLLQDLLAPVYQTMFPEISRAMVQGTRQLSAAIERTVLIGVSFASSVIVVGSAYGEPLVRVWVSKDVEFALPTTLLLGVYRSADFLISIVGISHFSAARMDRLIPYTVTNAILTILLTAFAVRGWGIVGVGTMNAAISTLMLMPLLYDVKKRYAPELALRRLFVRALGMLSVAAVVVSLAAWGASRLDGTVESALFCLTGPLAVGACYGLQVRFCGAPYPRSLVRQITSRWQGGLAPAASKAGDDDPLAPGGLD
jgi:O-antigen/teichoic acid export membrane protein